MACTVSTNKFLANKLLCDNLGSRNPLHLIVRQHRNYCSKYINSYLQLSPYFLFHVRISERIKFDIQSKASKATFSRVLCIPSSLYTFITITISYSVSIFLSKNIYIHILGKHSYIKKFSMHPQLLSSTLYDILYCPSISYFTSRIFTSEDIIHFFFSHLRPFKLILYLYVLIKSKNLRTHFFPFNVSYLNHFPNLHFFF